MQDNGVRTTLQKFKSPINKNCVEHLYSVLVESRNLTFVLMETFSTMVSFFFQVEKIRQVKAKSLYLQVEKLHQSLTKLDSTIAAVSQVLDEGRHLDVLLARERMLTQIHELKALRGLLQPQEDDRFMFTPPDQVGSSQHVG